MKDWIWNCGVVSLEGLKNKQKAWMEMFKFDKLKKHMNYTFFIASDQGCKTCNFLEARIFIQTIEL